MKSTSKFPDLSHPVVMGILNITPDSFFDGGRFFQPEDWEKQAGKMISDGAGIIDIGGASSRPGAEEISAEEEWKRISPALGRIRKAFPEITISIDTYHASVAGKAIEQGADMINDISGGSFDPGMAPLMGKHDAAFVIMHIQGRPGNMQKNPKYTDVVGEVKAFFRRQSDLFLEHGAAKLILDPGFGFGKTLEHNYELLKRLGEFSDLGFPLMAGLSRKSMINKVINTPPAQALNGTTVLNTIALLNGASLLRVHDVKEAVEVIELVGNLRSDF